MEIVLDFDRPRVSASGLPAPGDRLLACFQEALGHQLPNHLVALRGLARMLADAEGDRLDDEGRIYLERLEALAGRVDQTVRALADLGRLCREAPTGEPIVLAEVAREAGAEVNVLCNGPAVEYHFEGGLPLLSVSRRALYQVLVQLLRNAVQAAQPGRPPRVQMGARACPGGVECWVADNGRGLPPLSPERLFAPFSGERGEGLGLGLFLVRQMVAAWGGAIHVQSEPGQGTTFTLRIPGRKPEGPP
jgi:signal transduction histidine kinase